ncbi:MAG: DsbA family protein, partial [Gammaproteobacteria bacterium]|nr:DsbA family protein [Gammaproteobacteria bacterium]
NLMRGAVAAGRLGCSDGYVDRVFDAIWVHAQNMGDPVVISKVLAEAGLDAEGLIALSQDPEVKAELAANTEAAVARGVFGAPTMFMDGAMYFGQDRLDFIEEALQA